MELKSKRAEALAARQPFYFTGKKCIRGHIEKRQTADGCCVLCREEISRKGYETLKAFRAEMKDLRKLSESE